MKLMDKNDFIKRSSETLGDWFDMLAGLPPLRLRELRSDAAALVIVDMLNGFTREGALKSGRIEGIIPGIVELSRQCGELGIKKLAFADNHSGASPEFEAYPPHCMAGTREAEVVDEIKELGGYTLIPKNSTNGFLEEAFRKWLDENRRIDTFIVTGDCTDICIQQFAITLKTWFNMQDRKARIIVPAGLVETYDLGLHNGDLAHVAALYNMIVNGVEAAGRID